MQHSKLYLGTDHKWAKFPSFKCFKGAMLCAYACSHVWRRRLKRCVDPFNQTPREGWLKVSFSDSFSSCVWAPLFPQVGVQQSANSRVFVFAYVRLQVNVCTVDFGKMVSPPLIHGIINPDVLGWTDGRDGGGVPDLWSPRTDASWLCCHHWIYFIAHGTLMIINMMVFCLPTGGAKDSLLIFL